MADDCAYCFSRKSRANQSFCELCNLMSLNHSTRSMNIIEAWGSRVKKLQENQVMSATRIKKLYEKLYQKEHKINELQGHLVQKSEMLVEEREKLTFLQLPLSSLPSTDETWKGDVAIIVRNNTQDTLHAHKLILSSRSPVFRKMFDNDMVEKENGVVRIDDATHPVVAVMINFFYTSEINFNEEVTPEEVLEIAHKYSIHVLQKVCEKELIKTMNESNLPKRLKLSHKFEVRGLQKAMAMYFKDNFDSMISVVMEEMCDPPPCCTSCLNSK